MYGQIEGGTWGFQDARQCRQSDCDRVLAAWLLRTKAEDCCERYEELPRQRTAAATFLLRGRGRLNNRLRWADRDRPLDLIVGSVRVEVRARDAGIHRSRSCRGGGCQHGSTY